MRSRAVRRPLECWLSIAFCPPPSQIFSPSLRTCETRSARKRMLASKRAEVGSTLEVSTAEVEGARVSVRSAMGLNPQTDYGISAAQKGANPGGKARRQLENSAPRQFVILSEA